jgi:hypothetical protein
MTIDGNSTADDIRQYVDTISAGATRLYQNDVRMRHLIDSCVANALQDASREGDEHNYMRTAHDVARKACALLAARILEDDAELKATRAERDRYRQLAEETLRVFPSPQFTPL